MNLLEEIDQKLMSSNNQSKFRAMYFFNNKSIVCNRRRNRSAASCKEIRQRVRGAGERTASAPRSFPACRAAAATCVAPHRRQFLAETRARCLPVTRRCPILLSDGDHATLSPHLPNVVAAGNSDEHPLFRSIVAARQSIGTDPAQP
ncbi:MAG: hypothetical protein KDI53_18295 [Candidatus Accumulibacter sp.]|nr:hypothetical protein [Accumulibacter sp.]